MKLDPTSSPTKSKYKDEMIKSYILNFKREHDGISPAIRHVIQWYGDIEGLYASTSVMSYILKRICKKNGWSYTYRGIVTKGEWQNDNQHS
jgi:hypothetical protein